jgi:hypothetical protein
MVFDEPLFSASTSNTILLPASPLKREEWTALLPIPVLG